MANFETAADIVSAAALELGLISAAVADPYASLDPNVLQLCALLNTAGRQLVRKHGWSQLRSTYTFPTVDTTQTYALPAGFDRLVDGSVWDRTDDQPGVPINEQQYQHMSAVATPAGGAFTFFLKQDLFHIFPVPTSVRTIGYGYQTGYWAGGTTAPTASKATAAADKIWFDPPLIVEFLKEKFNMAKGFPASGDFSKLLEEARSADGAASVLNITGSHAPSFQDPLPNDSGLGS